jgi:hypothetical protein
MSEFSDSYHIRTDDPAGVKQRLRQARLAGVIFGPSGGWLTFVPYEELAVYRRSMVGDAFTVQLSQVLSATVLHYNFSEDHGWSFAVARPGEKLNRFACWWDPEPTIEREHLVLLSHKVAGYSGSRGCNLRDGFLKGDRSDGSQ